MPKKENEGGFTVYEDGSVKFWVRFSEGERPRTIVFDGNTELAKLVQEKVIDRLS